MRVLVVCSHYPPASFGGYEVECATVVDRLRAAHDVRVLTTTVSNGRLRSAVSGVRGIEAKGSSGDRAAPSRRTQLEDRDRDFEVLRALPLLTPDQRGAVRAPVASLRAAAVARQLLRWRPDLIYVWNGSSIPQAALRVFADSGVPLAFRVCEHWFGRLFLGDQYLRELVAARRSPLRGFWARGCQLLNQLPTLRLDPLAPTRGAISWNSQTLARMVPVPTFFEVTSSRVEHSVPPYGDLYADIRRDPAPVPEILFLGRVTAYKGLRVAIEALALLVAQHSIDARLRVVGPEERGYGREMRGLAARLGVGERVQWCGPLEPAQIRAALARAHALIVPSLWEEPFPLVTIEAALARVPVVAADVGGIGEGMQHEIHALLFPRGDAAAAALCLARTLREPEQTAARVARARERAEAFRLGPYLERQEEFVVAAASAA